ncbi:extracellular solute-binding protein [Bradyrhizobium sp. CSA207]|uniref:extracellular solute-binding protein n=1 Tax=Bradyrhizobium sp. CSA207 TaxID=2698826 RepID=UPI0023AEB032|nr:extracellular solute-binding protein [Bradyrhizobium sp. CSA207]MDE5446999.1 extracellular solute-binding protein [Bradyrhizobium sp. CSA207]
MRTTAMTLSGALLVLATVNSAYAEQISLRVTYAFPSRDGAYRETIANEFMRRHPGVKIKLESNAVDCPALLQQTLRSSMTNDLPDIIAPVCYPDMPILAARAIVTPLNDFISNDKSWNDVGLAPTALSTVQWQGKAIALPESISTPVVYYNMAIIRKAHPDLKDLPASWNNILKLAQDVNENGKHPMPIFFEYYPDNYNWSFNGLVYSLGGDVFDQNGDIAFNSAEGMDALNVLRRIGKAGMIDITTEQARQSFASGNIAIYVASSSLLNFLTASATDRFEIRTGPFPLSLPDGKLPSGGGGLVMTTKDAEKQKAAWEYMKFAVGPEAQTIMATNTGLTPVNARAASSPEFLGDFYKGRPNYSVAIEQLSKMKSVNLYPGQNGQRIATIIRDHLQSVITLKRSPEQAMPDMVRDVTSLLPKK